jgi:hypothetical protein
MNIIANTAQILALSSIDYECFVTACEKTPAKAVTVVKLLSVTAQQPLHTDAQVGPRRFYDQVKMIGHEGKAVHLPRRSFTGASEQIEEKQSISVIVYDRLAAIASAQNMIDGTCVLDSEGTSHISSVRSGDTCVNTRI